MKDETREFLARDGATGLIRSSMPATKTGSAINTVADELATFLEIAEEGYAICICNVPAVRIQVLKGIGPRLKAAGVSVFELDLGPETKIITAAIRKTIASKAFVAREQESKTVAISVNNVTDLVREEEWESGSRPAALQGLNQQRDWVRKLGRPVLFWVSEWLVSKLPLVAPDFWVGRSVVFEFPTEQESLTRSYEQLGGHGISFSSLDEARRKIRIYEDLLKNARNERDRAAYLGNLGAILQQLGELDKALGYYTQALKVTEDIGARREQAGVLGNIGLIWQTKGELDKALEYQEQALKIDREIGHRQWEAQNLGNIGIIYQNKGELDKALEYHTQAVKVFEDIGARREQASVFGNIGNIYQLRGELDEALEYQEKALKIDRDIGNRQGEAAELGNIGTVHGLKGELDKALECNQKAMVVNREIGNKLDEARNLGNIGNIYQLRGELGKALEYQEQALKVTEEIGAKREQASVLGNIGNIYQLRGELDRALEYQEQALKIDRKIENRQGAASALLNIGSVFIDKMDWEQAIACYVPSLMEFLAMGIADGPGQCLAGLRTCYRAMKEAAARFVELCVKAGMPEDDAKELVEMIEQAEAQQPEE